MRFQVRKRARLWEVWVLWPNARSWERLRQFGTWGAAMWLATNDETYARPGYRLFWEPRMEMTCE